MRSRDRCCHPHSVPSSLTNRSRAAALTARIAAIRKAHGLASAVAQLERRDPPPYSHLSALGHADHFPAMLAGGTVPEHVVHSLGQVLAAIERELAQQAD